MTTLANRFHFTSLDDFEPEDILRLFEQAEKMRNGLEAKKVEPTLRNLVVALFFAEPSTRIALSFQAATQRLGGSTISNPVTSLVKGETLTHTLRIIPGYADIIVLRHSLENTHELVQDVRVPVINSGAVATNILLKL